MSPVSPALDSSHSLPTREQVTEPSLTARLRRGRGQILALTVLGFSLGGLLVFLGSRAEPNSSRIRIALSFPGFERGEYPDGSQFQTDDLRRPMLIRDVLTREGIETPGALTAFRHAVSIQGVVPVTVVADRDQQRNAGLEPPIYVPDEYEISLTPDSQLPLKAAKREELLTNLVSAYIDGFRRTFGSLPAGLGHAFETLQNADYAEYDLILNTEFDNLNTFLDDQQRQAKSFRSRTTGFTFRDLSEQAELFRRIHLNEVLGLIREHGLSRNRATAVLKLDNQLRLLADRERDAAEEQKLISDLLARTQTRSQDYVVGVASEAARMGSTPLIDQGMVDSLLVNDANNFLIHRALDAGVRLAAIQTEKAKATALRDNMETFLHADTKDQSAAVAEVQKSINTLKANYLHMIDTIRRTQADFAEQQFGNAIQISLPASTPTRWPSVVLWAVLGGFLGTSLGAGLSLLGGCIWQCRTPRP